MAITDRAAAQVLVAAVHMTRVTEVAALIPVFRATRIIRAVLIKVAKVVTINNLAKGVSNSSNLGIRVIQNS